MFKPKGVAQHQKFNGYFIPRESTRFYKIASTTTPLAQADHNWVGGVFFDKSPLPADSYRRKIGHRATSHPQRDLSLSIRP